MSVLDRFSLSGRTALVTGAGRGIGRSYCLALAEAGADVAVVDLDAENARTVAEEVTRMDRQSLVITADVTQLDQIELMVSQVIDAWGRLDIGVNNAGIANATPAEDIPEQEWDAIISVNLKGVFFCCQAEARAMFAAKSGSIINTASISGQTVNRPQTHAHYNAHQGGCSAVVEDLRYRMGGAGYPGKLHQSRAYGHAHDLPARRGMGRNLVG